MIEVVAGVIETRGRLLICQRRRGSLFELQWEFPGGKLQEGESPAELSLRGYVDAFFPRAADALGRIRCVNLRDEKFPSVCLR